MSRESRRVKIVGAIFPILRKHISNLFSHDRVVFVKFTKMNLESGFTIVFYVSREKSLIGEAKVRHTERLSPDVAWSRYKNSLFLEEQEYNEYVRISPINKEKRKMSEVTVLELKNSRRYKKPVKPIYPVTPSGRYLTKQMVKKIRSLSVQ